MPSRHSRDRRAELRAFLRRALEGAGTALRRTWQAFRRRGTRVEVVLANHQRARAIEHEVRAQLRRLRRGVPELRHFDDLTVLVQLTMGASRREAGYCEYVDFPDGRQVALLRLALSVDGRWLTTDKMLANLADLYVDLVIDDRSTVVTPMWRMP